VFTMGCVRRTVGRELKSRARPRRELDGAGLLTLGSTHEFICNPCGHPFESAEGGSVLLYDLTSNYFESASPGPPDGDMVNSLFTTSGGGFGPPPNIPLPPDRYWELIPVSQKETI